MGRLTNEKNKEKAVAAFIEKTAAVRAHVEKLSDLLDDHFNVDPDSVNWAHVGSLTKIATDLEGVVRFACSVTPESPPKRGLFVELGRSDMNRGLTFKKAVGTVAKAQRVVRAYIDENELGSGCSSVYEYFTGGKLWMGGICIGHVSYNGRAWNADGTEML